MSQTEVWQFVFLLIAWYVRVFDQEGPRDWPLHTAVSADDETLHHFSLLLSTYGEFYAIEFWRGNKRLFRKVAKAHKTLPVWNGTSVEARKCLI